MGENGRGEKEKQKVEKKRKKAKKAIENEVKIIIIKYTETAQERNRKRRKNGKEKQTTALYVHHFSGYSKREMTIYTILYHPEKRLYHLQIVTTIFLHLVCLSHVCFHFDILLRLTVLHK